MDVDDLNDWQSRVYEVILERGPVTKKDIVLATALPASQVGPLLHQLEQLGLILRRDDGWYAP